VPSPVRLPWDWRGWERDFHDRYLEPDDRRPVALARLELRWPVGSDRLPIPGRLRRPGVPNLPDATRAVEAVVAIINATVEPVLAELEVSQR
jgi:hypothetical protein